MMHLNQTICLSLSVLLVSCMPSVDLIDEDDGDQRASEERLLRMNLTVEATDGADGWLTATEEAPGAVDLFVRTHCQYQVTQTRGLTGCFSQVGACATNAICPSQSHLCRALTLRELATTVGPVVLTGTGGDPAYRVQPPDTESRAALEQLAQIAARDSMVRASLGMRGGDCANRLFDQVGSGPEGVPGPEDDLPQTVGELFASTLVEALELGERAAHQGARHSIAIADRDRTAISNRGRAARLTWFDDNLSRTLAAQSLIGGVRENTPLTTETLLPVQSSGYGQDDSNNVAVQDLTQTGIGAQPPCTEDCARALHWLRYSGAPLDDVVADAATTSIASLITVHVSPRLAERLSRPELSGLDDVGLAAELGFAPIALRQARSWMRHEAAVHARFALLDALPLGAELPPLMPEQDGTPVPYLLAYDPGTLSVPRPPPSVHYLSAVQAPALWEQTAMVPIATGLSSVPLPRMEAAYLFDYAHNCARDVIAEEVVNDAASGVLATIIQDAFGRDASRIEVCKRHDIGGTGDDFFRMRVLGAPTSEVRRVFGSTSMRCVVDGRLDDLPCEIDPMAWDSTAEPPDATGTLPDTRSGWTEYAEWNDQVAHDSATRRRIYMVRRRPHREDAPGGHEAIGGFSLDTPTTPEWECVIVPFDRRSYESAAEHIEMTPTLEPLQVCGAKEFDPGPLPLEDEIIDDGDAFETSWRHHLQVAVRTSAHADALGQRLLQSGQDIDRRSEEALDELIELCGVSVNLEALFSPDGTAGEIDLSSLINGSTCDATTPCETGYACVGTRCVATVLVPEGTTEFEADEILNCLGLDPDTFDASGDVDVVGLGDTPLCLWFETDSPEILCRGAVNGNCPFPADQDADGAVGFSLTDCEAQVIEPGTATMLFVGGAIETGPGRSNALLELFSSVSPDGGAIGLAADPTDCDLFRAARGSGRFLVNLQRTGVFSYENARLWADRIGWRAYPLDFSELTVDGAPWQPIGTGQLAATGYPFSDYDASRTAGPSTAGSWPCGAPLPGILCPSGSDSLFCSFASCSALTDGVPADRVRFNHRMGRAAATLGTLTGVGLSTLYMPAYYESLDSDTGTGGTNEYTDQMGRRWRVWDSREFGEGNTLSGMIVVPLDAGVPVWYSRQNGGGLQLHESGPSGNDVRDEQPFGFVNFGASYRDNDEARAATIARALWAGLVPGTLVTATTQDTDFFQTLTASETGTAEARAVFRSALQSEFDEGTERIAGRDAVFGAGHGIAFHELGNLFVKMPFDTGGDFSNVNRAHLFEDDDRQSRITNRDLLDAMELMCQLSSELDPLAVPECGDPPAVYSMADVGRVQTHMRCLSRRLEALSHRQVVQNLPIEVVRNLRGEAGDIRPDIGRYGDLIIELTIALRATAEAPRQMAAILLDMADAIELLRLKQAELDLTRALNFLRGLSESLSAASQCASSAGGGNFAAGAVCGIAAAQIAIAIATTSIQDAIIGLGAQEEIIRFSQTMRGYAESLRALENTMTSAADQVGAITSRLRSTRASARSALARAAFADSDAAGRQFSLNTAMRRVYDINRIRYAEAQDAARLSAIIARAAVEQRFGVDLANQQCASLVEPPSGWANDICSATGINYAEIRDPDFELTDEVAGQLFVGDYVRRLEQWVESYRFDYPYTSADDTVVVSLRDDINPARGACSASAPNLLGASNDLRAAVLPEPDGTVAETPFGAWTVPVGGCLGAGLNCVQRTEAAADVPLLGATGLIGSRPPQAFGVTFAPNTPTVTSDYTNNAALVQDVILEAGLYRLSWYVHRPAMVEPEPTVGVTSTAALDVGMNVLDVSPTLDSLLGTDWVRRFIFFRVPSSVTDVVVSVGVFPASMSPPLHPQTITVAGLQLEDVTTTVGLSSGWASLSQGDVDEASDEGVPEVLYPTHFAATTAPGFALYDACETDDPGSFRQNRFTYRCDRLCREGFDRCEPGETGETFCYWETTFNLTDEQLLSRERGFGGGFAFGNYNYRTGDIAVNVVGTGVLDCSGPEARSCLATGAIPFTLEHRPIGSDDGYEPGAYPVLTHTGDTYPANLRAGRIESARALTAERYITNPISSADRALIQDYRRGELRGRPMPGRYVLRIWDAPGVSFGAVEDIQIVWDYRYFTRTGEPLCSPTDS